MSFSEALENKPVQKYDTKLTRLLRDLPGPEADALELLLQDGSRKHVHISRIIREEEANHPDLDPNLFRISDKSVARYREDAYSLVTGL